MSADTVTPFVTALPMRNYQRSAVEAVEAAWARGLRAPAIVLPTGAGKSCVFAHVIHRWNDDSRRAIELFRRDKGLRVLVLAHRAELLDQAVKTILDVAPDLTVGMVAAELDETDADVVVGSVQTLRLTHRMNRLDDIGLIITDEAHHVALGNSYTKIFDAFPDALMLGVTATMSRSDGKALGDVWQEIVYEKPILELIKSKYLSDVRGVQVKVPDLDLSGVKSSRGDYQEGQLGEALEASLAPEVVAAAYVEHAKDRKGLCFTPTVSSAFVMSEALNRAGVTTEVVYGEMNKSDRRDVLRRFRDGTTQVLSNCMTLTEGFDAPEASCAVIARPTKSAALFAQICGRVLRPHPSKDHALVLDVVGASAIHSLCSLSTLAGRLVREGQSLEEAEVEELEALAEATGRNLKPIHDGDVEAVEVDLFGASRWRWRATKGGLWYIGSGVRYWVLLPGAEPGTWDVAWVAGKGAIDGKFGAFEKTAMTDTEIAMAWAESGASQDDPMGSIGQKGRGWHRSKPSDKQKSFATSLGIVVTDSMRQLEVSDAIDAVMASRVIDSRLLRWLQQEGRIAK